MKQDYLGECNNLKVPLEEFAAQFCFRCLQPECTRSQAGKSRLEARIDNWQDKLFKNPPRMQANDPRYSNIQGKRFLDIVPSSSYEIRGGSPWVDPRDIGVVAAPTPPPVQVLAQPEPEATTPLPPSVETVEKSESPAPLLRNTPFKQGQMLKGAPSPVSIPVHDPWAAPKVSQTEGVRVVKSGAKIKLGG